MDNLRLLMPIDNANAARYRPVQNLNGRVVRECCQNDGSRSLPLQTHHAYSTLKRRGNGRFHVVSTWNTRGLFYFSDSNFFPTGISNEDFKKGNS